MQLVLRVKTDEALQYTSEDAAERLRLELREKNIAGPTITVPGPTRIVVAGVPPAMERPSVPSPTPSPGWRPSTTGLPAAPAIRSR